MHEYLVAIKLGVKNIKANLGRTLISLTGIVIAVASVILVQSLGQGVKGYVLGQVESFGTDLIQVEVKVPNTPRNSTQNASAIAGGTQITTFKLKDAETLGRLNNIKGWYGGSIAQYVVQYLGYDEQTMMMGVTSGIGEVDELFKVADGRVFSEEESRAAQSVTVLGYGISQKLFGDSDPNNSSPVGQRIKIKGQSFEVLGVLKERGSTGFFSFDDLIYIPTPTLQKKLSGDDFIQFASFKVEDNAKIELTALEMTEVMRDLHDIDDPDKDDFSVTPITEALDIISGVFSSINILLLILTSISLVVGGVNIMNVMYVSVTERTFEIGLRKSLGAKNADILKQFLFEAVLITMVGGILGIIIGFLLSRLGTFAVTRFNIDLDFTVTGFMVVTGFLFSAAAGLIFGSRPAYKASLLSPMEALRKD